MIFFVCIIADLPNLSYYKPFHGVGGNLPLVKSCRKEGKRTLDTIQQIFNYSYLEKSTAKMHLLTWLPF